MSAPNPDDDIGWPGGRLRLSERVHVMGVLNVTPDSFSDGGLHADADAAVDAALRMVEEGADIIDVGGESTRPGAPEVPAEEETRRVARVIESLRAKTGVPISIDTRKADVARAALDAGADIVNDVSALRDDPGLGPFCAERECPVILMHMKGTPRTMQADPQYEDVAGEVREFLGGAVARAEAAGIARERIIVDPGIGFGKTIEHNLTLVNRLDEIAPAGRPVLLGASRKSFIGKTLGIDSPAERLEGTLAVTALAVARGARIIRVHDVKANVRVVRMAEAVISERPTALNAENAKDAENGNRHAEQLRLDGVTNRVIGAAIAVHQALGPGLLESTYSLCLEHELRARGMRVEREKPLDVVYDGVRIDGGYRVDLLVDDDVVVELKSVQKLLPIHEAQLLTYLKHAGLKVGLLLNFNVTLLKNGLQRVVRGF